MIYILSQMNTPIIKIHMIKYVLYEFYKLGLYLSDVDGQFFDIIKNFITFTHDKIVNIKYFENVNLSAKYMYNVQLYDSCTTDIDLSRSIIISEKNLPRNFFNYPPLQWNFCRICMNKINFTGTSMTNITFFKVILTTVDFTNANLSFSYFVECKFDNVTFNNTNLSNSMFDECEFINNEFDNADVRHAKFIYCNFRKTTFANSKLSNCLLHNICSWNDSSFTDCFFDNMIIDDVSKFLINIC